MFKQITWKQLKELRKKQWILQERKCAVLNKEIDYKDATMDHKHLKKGEKIGKNGAGLLRGVLDFRVNAFEGKVLSWYKRRGLHKLIDLPSLLRNLAKFLENPPMKPVYIHPSENKKPKKLGKRDYNKLCKYYFKIYPKKKRLPKYPRSGKMTKTFEKYMKDLEEFMEKK